jgi:hypothetical protein
MMRLWRMNPKTLTIEDEEQIRVDLRRGCKIESLVAATGRSHATIGRIKKILRVIEFDTPELYGVETKNYKNVVRLAKLGQSKNVISNRLKILPEYVLAIMRHAYVTGKRSKKRKKCPTCGNILIEPIDDPQVKTRNIEMKPLNFVNVSCILSEDAISILEDLESLDSLGLIGNPLFCELAKRSAKLLDEVEEACRES